MNTVELYSNLSHQYPDVLNFQEPLWFDILKYSHTQNIPEHTCLFRETEQRSNFMWLLEGTVRVLKHSPSGREITLYRVNPGELCVLSIQSLMGDHKVPASAVAETDLVGLVMNKLEFDHAFDESKDFSRYLLRYISQRLGDVMQLISEVTFQRLELRLACLLWKLFTNEASNSVVITHEKLAHELGTTREMVSRLLKEFEVKQCIKLARGKIHLVSKDMLEWFTHI